MIEFGSSAYWYCGRSYVFHSKYHGLAEGGGRVSPRRATHFLSLRREGVEEIYFNRPNSMRA